MFMPNNGRRFKTRGMAQGGRHRSPWSVAITSAAATALLWTPATARQAPMASNVAQAAVQGTPVRCAICNPAQG